jgi:hypothetical protein
MLRLLVRNHHERQPFDGCLWSAREGDGCLRRPMDGTSHSKLQHTQLCLSSNFRNCAVIFYSLLRLTRCSQSVDRISVGPLFLWGAGPIPLEIISIQSSKFRLGTISGELFSDRRVFVLFCHCSNRSPLRSISQA